MREESFFLLFDLEDIEIAKDILVAHDVSRTRMVFLNLSMNGWWGKIQTFLGSGCITLGR